MRVAVGVPLLIGSAPTDAAAASPVNVDVRYECLWWSPAEMVDLDPNHPPPKTHRIALARWEYSDPIGVPHPDSVDLVIGLTAPPRSSLSIQVATRWRVRNRWTKWINRAAATVRPGGRRAEVRVSVPVKDAIYRLSPKFLQSKITVDGHTAATRNLPIQLGD